MDPQETAGGYTNVDGRQFLARADHFDQTTVTPIGLTILLLLGMAMLFLPRRHALISILICASIIGVGQRLVIFTVDFSFLRIMVLFGCARIFMRQEFQNFRSNPLDKWVLAWAATSFVTNMISTGFGGVPAKLGATAEYVGTYFLVRMLVRTLDDVRTLIDDLAILSIPVACFFFMEYTTRQNLFSIFGGVPAVTIIREGRLRCQGAYSHPILAGCFWAVLIPLFIGRLLSKGSGRLIATVGLMMSLTIIGMSASSTPVVGVMAGVAGFLFYPARAHMKTFRRLLLCLVIGLHFCMEAPVWHLVSRTDFAGGSTGYHRFIVIDQFIKHFHEWVLFGTTNIAHWNIFANDITNQYVGEGVAGGAPALILFVIVISAAFGNVGRLWRLVSRSSKDTKMAWAIGVSLFVHAINFIGVSYWGQISCLWYISLALTAVSLPQFKTQRQ